MQFLKLTAPQLHDLIELCEEGQNNRESDADEGVEDAQAAYDTSVEVLERLYSLRDTPAKPRTITIHVRGGVAYPPARVPAGIHVRIIDHDNH